MGCAPLKKKQVNLEHKQSIVGLLRIFVYGVHIHQEFKVKESNLRLRVSNQHFTTNKFPLIEAVQKKMAEGQCFSFIINSFYKACGRSLEVGYFQGQTMLCFGAFDLGLLLEHKKSQEFRCILSEKQIEKGYVLLRGQFQTLSYCDLTFRFETATIRRKSGVFGGSDMIAVRMIIGEEELETEYQKDTMQKPPTWQDKKYNFKVPQGLLKGLVQLINDKGQTLGQCQLNIDEMLKVKQDVQVFQSQQLFFKKKESQLVAADLKYSFVMGRNPVFMPRNELFATTMRGTLKNNETQVEMERHPNN